MAELLPEYVDNDLNAEERALVRDHLRDCPDCRAEEKRVQEVAGLMGTAIGPASLRNDFAEDTGRQIATGTHEDFEEESVEAPPESFVDALTARTGAAPWWIISGAFHTLVILLVTLIGLAILRAQDEDVVIVTDLEQRKDVEDLEEPVKRDIIPKPQTVLDEEIESEQMPIVTHEEVEVADEVETDNDSEFNETRGEDGISDVWLGGSGTVAALGLGGGGGGAFGRPNGRGGRLRRAIRGGGSAKTESAVDRALEWLARHQDADGGWSLIDSKPTGHQAEKVKGMNGRAALTGFALLAFMGAGHTDRIGKYKRNVDAGLQWMIRSVEKTEKTAGEGRYSKTRASNYTQGVAGLAMSEAAGMCANPKIKEVAQRVVNGVISGQIKDGPSEYQSWDYMPGGRTNDTSIMGWNVMALKSGKIAGLKVDPAAFEGTMRWIRKGQDMRGAKDGNPYWTGGQMSYRGTLSNPDRKYGQARTAIVALTRLFLGNRPDHPGVAGPCNLMAKREWLPSKWPGNLYYWYYATLAMFQTGGDHWKAWNEAMKPTLLNSQRRDGDYDGSWDPVPGAGINAAGRVMSTALGAMCLEVYYRYLPVYR